MRWSGVRVDRLIRTGKLIEGVWRVAVKTPGKSSILQVLKFFLKIPSNGINWLHQEGTRHTVRWARWTEQLNWPHKRDMRWAEAAVEKNASTVGECNKKDPQQWIAACHACHSIRSVSKKQSLAQTRKINPLQQGLRYWYNHYHSRLHEYDESLLTSTGASERGIKGGMSYFHKTKSVKNAVGRFHLTLLNGVASVRMRTHYVLPLECWVDPFMALWL